MPRFKFVHPRAIQYTSPSFVAEPGETYDWPKAPVDKENWQPVKGNQNNNDSKEE